MIITQDGKKHKGFFEIEQRNKSLYGKKDINGSDVFLGAYNTIQRTIEVMAAINDVVFFNDDVVYTMPRK